MSLDPGRAAPSGGGTTVTPLTSTPYFIFGETAEIQPPQPTASQTMPVSMALPPPFVTSATRANLGLPDTLVFTIPRSGEAQEFTNTGIPIVPDELFLNPGIQSEEAPRIDEAVNVPYGNVTPTGQASLPPGAQKAISEICDQYLRQSSGKYWGVAAIPKGIAAMPPIAAILQQYLAMGIAAMLLQHCNCGCVAAVLLQYLVAAILLQWGHCCNTLCTLQQSAMPQRIAATLWQ